MMKLKIGVVGSRNYHNNEEKEKVKKEVINLMNYLVDKFDNEIEFVSGEAKKGVDLWVKNFVIESEKLNKEDNYEGKKPDFEKYEDIEFNVKYYHKRNREIAKYSDLVFAFQYNDSNGTQSTINKCEEENTPCIVSKIYYMEGDRNE